MLHIKWFAIEHQNTYFEDAFCLLSFLMRPVKMGQRIINSKRYNSKDIPWVNIGTVDYSSPQLLTVPWGHWLCICKLLSKYLKDDIIIGF